MIGAETMFLLLSGLLAGIAGAVIAVSPAWLARGGSGPGGGLALLLAAIALAGIVSAAVATRAASGGRLLDALRAESGFDETLQPMPSAWRKAAASGEPS